MSSKKLKPFPSAVLSDLFVQLALFEKSGISIFEAVSIMGAQSANKSIAEVCVELSEALKAGSTLTEAAHESGRFPVYSLTMLEIGERTGMLGSIAESLSRYYDQRDILSKSLRSALLYPLCMTVMALCVVWVVLVEVMPVFEQVFEQLGISMDAFSRELLNLGQALNAYSFIIAAVLAVFIVFILIIRCTARGVQLLHNWFEGSVFTRRLAQNVYAQRFALCMSLMFKSGLDIDTALDLSRSAVTGAKAQKRIEAVQQSMLSGSTFTDAVSKSGILPFAYEGLMLIAGRTGENGEILGIIAQRCGRDADDLMQRRIAAIEPVIVAFLCVIVGMVLLSVILPLTGILANM